MSAKYVPPSMRNATKNTPLTAEKVDLGEAHFPSLGPKRVVQVKQVKAFSMSEMIQEKIKEDSKIKIVETDLENMSYEQLAEDGWYVFPLCYWKDIVDKFYSKGSFGHYNFSKIQGLRWKITKVRVSIIA